MSTTAETFTAAPERCASCATILTGPYCSQCGERRLEADALTLRHFLTHTVLHELLHVDGKLVQTLRLLLARPGRLTREYAAGRRRPYVNPFRLLLIAIVVYALMGAAGLNVTLNLGPVIMSVAPPAVRRTVSVEGTIDQIDRYGLLRRPFEAKRDRLTSDGERERFHNRMAAFAQPASFANVILLAVALHLLFWRQRHAFLEHAAFSMHVVSFVLFSSVALFVAIRMRFWLGNYLFLVIGLVAAWQFAYLGVAVRRFYLPSGRWIGRVLAVTTAVLIYFLNSAFMTAVQVAGAAIALALA